MPAARSCWPMPCGFIATCLMDERGRASADSHKGAPVNLAQRVKTWLDELGR